MSSRILIHILLFNISLTIRNVTIFGNNTLGYYYLEAYVGTPPQKKSLILDTGSHMTIFPCHGCTNCRDHLYKIFDSTKSSSYDKVKPNNNYFDWTCSSPSEENTCKFVQSYTEGSEYSGVFAMDNFIFENELQKDSHKNLKHIFGCAMRETNLFYSQEVDGIIGFGVISDDKSKLKRSQPSAYDIRY